MLKYFDSFDEIFCDIDDTIIHGFMVQVMHYGWKWFHNPKLIEIFMNLQAKLHLYKVNEKLRFLLTNTKAHITFLTVRKPCKGNREMLEDIFPDLDFDLIELETDEGHIKKLGVIDAHAGTYGDKCLLIDDNNRILEYVNEFTLFNFLVTTFNSKLLRERLV